MRRVNPNLLGASVGGLLVATNARTLLLALEVGVTARVAVYVVLAIAWGAALAAATRRIRRQQANLPTPPPPTLVGAGQHAS